jgi:hypothetical protein
MSVQTEVSPSLFWHPFEGSVEKEPLFVQYQKYQAQSASSSDISWYFECPANGVLLDNEVWIQYELTITDDATAANSFRYAWGNAGTTYAAKNSAPNSDNAIGFRLGNPLQRCCQTIALDINGTVMTYEMAKYHDVFNRMFVSNEESESIFPACGGHFDNGAHLGFTENYCPDSTDLTKVGNQVTITTGKVTPFLVSNNKGKLGTAETTNVLGSFIPLVVANTGLEKRLQHFEYIYRSANKDFTDSKNDSATVPERYPLSVTLTLYEKLAISPFHMYDNRDIKMSIPNIRNVQLTFQIHNLFREMMFRNVAAKTEDLKFKVDWWSGNKPNLLCRWYTPPPGYTIPKQITIPITKVWTYTYPLGQAMVATNGTDGFPRKLDGVNIQNISLPAVPDMFLIYFKRRQSQWNIQFPDDYNASIASLQIDMEGNSGKLNGSNPIHFWNMYRRHLRLYPCSRDDFDSWYKYHCVYAITASDLGVIKGPGMDNPIQLSVSNVKLEYWYRIPSMNFQTNLAAGSDIGSVDSCPERDLTPAAVYFDFQLVCIYDKYALTLTSEGSSQLQLLRVNSAGSSTAPQMSFGTSLADVSI